jgi:two-component system phosphate regulon response regulator PhoB
VRPIRILLVDDDVQVRELVRMTLPAEDLEVSEAGDVETALRLLDADDVPDLVLLDWVMPGGNGATVLEELKRRGAELPVLVLTAEQDAATRAEAEQLGADAFLTKPFSPLQLLGEIERLLPDRRP